MEGLGFRFSGLGFKGLGPVIRETFLRVQGMANRNK
jgi:hypothetical protein